MKKPWTKWELRRQYILRGAREGIIQVEALMNALARARRSTNPAAIIEAEAAIKKSALKITVNKDEEYIIDILPGEPDPDMEKIGEGGLANAGISVTGELDAYGRPISAYIQVQRFIMPWQTTTWRPWLRREEKRKRELALAFANCFQSQFTQSTH
jgi:hypothetical protein